MRSRPVKKVILSRDDPPQEMFSFSVYSGGIAGERFEELVTYLESAQEHLLHRFFLVQENTLTQKRGSAT